MTKLNYMQCWNGAMALLGAHKEAILAIAGVFLFLPTFLMAHFVEPPILTGDESALVAWPFILRWRLRGTTPLQKTCWRR